MSDTEYADEQPEEDSVEFHAAVVSDTLHIGEGVDPLKALLELDERIEDVSETFEVPLLDGTKVPWTVRALGSDEVDEINERCTRFVKRGRGQKTAELDTKRFYELLVGAATISPNLAAPEVLAKYRCRHAHEVVGKVLLPGTIDGLTSKILEVSGYTDDLVEVGKV